MGLRIKCYLLVLFAIMTSIINCQTSRYDWKRPDELNVGLPSSVEIYTLEMDNSPFNTKLTGGFARFDMTDSNL